MRNSGKAAIIPDPDTGGADVTSPGTLPCLTDRKLISLCRIGTSGTDGPATLSDKYLSGNGTLTSGDDQISMAYRGKTASYQLRLDLPDSRIANGIGARIRLRGWEKIDYIGIGYTWEGAFQHVKAANPPIDQWYDFLVGHHDLAWGWRNGWKHPQDRPISDIRLYIKGRPGDESHLDVSEMFLWLEDVAAVDNHLGAELRLPSRVRRATQNFTRYFFETYREQAQDFLETGRCPLTGNTMLNWPSTADLPTGLENNNTYQFSWHGLHAATMLMLYGQDSGEMPPILAARDMISGWLERSYFRPDPNLKYAWYDHGVAERCLSLVQMYDIGQQYGFDHRFMSRLRLAIFRHAQLLASEVFYAGHQPYRYHNHAWFQDLTLLAVSLSFPAWPGAKAWADTALMRLDDQFATLIKRDSGFSVFIENSIGYHHGIERIVEFVGVLAGLSRRQTNFPDIARELSGFSEFFRYPDARRSLSQGDTFRLPNSDGPNPRGQIPYGVPEVTVLPQAGYGVVKSDHDSRPFMLVMLATSLSRTHKHEDNLSFTLYFDGVEWLIDPSFYCHEYADAIPAYLRSAAAHNCVYLPDLPYSIDPGLAQLDGNHDGQTFQFHGQHSACDSAVVHRKIEGRLDRLEMEITDRVDADKPGIDARLMLHCGEGVQVEVAEQQLILRHPGSDYSLRLDMPAGKIGLHHGVVKDDLVRGITGHGFNQHAGIDTVEVALKDTGHIEWRIRAEPLKPA